MGWAGSTSPPLAQTVTSFHSASARVVAKMGGAGVEAMKNILVDAERVPGRPSASARRAHDRSRV